MRASLVVSAVLVLSLLGGCTVVDLRVAPDSAHSDALVSGYVDAGIPARDSLLKAGLFKGPSRGSMLYLQLWKLLRLEVGFLGLAAGIGPLDAGVGVLLYEPRPPEYIDGSECDEECADDGHEHGEMHEDHEHAEHDHEDHAAEHEDGGEHPFVYRAY